MKLAALTLLAACAATDPTPPRPAVRVAPPMIARLDRAPGIVEPAATPTESARAIVARLASRWGVELPPLEARGEIPYGADRVVRLAQIVDGIPVESGELHVLVRASGELVAASGVPVDVATPRAPAVFADDEAAATRRAAAGIAVTRSRAQKVWHRDGTRLVAAWLVEAFLANGDAIRVVTAGDDGRVLAERSLVESDAAYRVYADTQPEVHPHDGPLVDDTPHPTGTPDNSYPPLAASSLLTVHGLDHPAGGGPADPWLPPGATVTTGNNLDAYADFNAPDGFSTGDIRASTTSADTFDRGYDFTASALVNPAQQMASITSLFFTINWLHDFWYDAGFVETAGNAQLSNYGRGGIENDPLLGETDDDALGGSRNNANMATPDDGMSPRMQVFVWSGHQDRTLTLSPGGALETAAAAFGPTEFTTTASIQAVTGATTTACGAIAAATGKIVFVDRGVCSYKTKAKNAQAAGAIGMIVANNVAGQGAPGMGDDSTITTAITLSPMAISFEDGQALRAALANGDVMATLHLHSDPEIDGALDATVVAHEHGHYLHHRLSQCNTPICGGMSEGWADFSALMMIAHPGDDLAGAYPIGQYATISFANDPAYFGIRRVPYSVTRSIDPLTFGDMADGQALPMIGPIKPSGPNSEVHNTGEVWATALWEVYVALQRLGPDFTTARAKIARYIVAGLLLAPPDATPTEMRDAILVAIGAQSTTDADHAAAAFARRGFGSCAVSPPRDSIDNVGIVESTILSGHALLGDTRLADDAVACDLDGTLDVGETATVTVPLANDGYHGLTDVTVTLTSPTPGITITTPPVAIGDLAAASHRDVPFLVSYAGPKGMPMVGELDVTVRDVNGCVDALSRAIPIRLETDEVPQSSADDHFDALDSPWSATSALVWDHVHPTALDGAWHGANLGRRADASLVSPALDVAPDADLTIAFSHRFSFEFGSATAWDGGLIEYTTDGGTTWQDVATLLDPGYTGTITDQADNPLKLRPAYVHQNAAYPAADRVVLDFGRQLAGMEVKLRFRIGSDANTGDAGWTIDDLSVSGLSNTPFPTVVGDNDVCGVGPGIDAGADAHSGSGTGGCCGTAPASPSNLLLGLGIFQFVRRRRRPI